MPLDLIGGISSFFQWLYVTVVSVWQWTAIIVLFLIFIGIQIGFIAIYIRVYFVIVNAYPKIKELFYRVDKFFT